jgi:hypothetical protein
VQPDSGKEAPVLDNSKNLIRVGNTLFLKVVERHVLKFCVFTTGPRSNCPHNAIFSSSTQALVMTTVDDEVRE